MSNKNKKQKVPKWFKGMIYDKGEICVNPFTEQSYALTRIELSIYDFILGSQYIMEVAPKTVTPKHVAEFQKALNWFRKNNAEAYFVLLD
tara:strand:- start:3090 stop:3359 length:270 start_codon:yes stop_codon:yes gene_type:complete